MELQHFSHEHPLFFSDEGAFGHIYCSGCGNYFWGPRFSCEDCGYNLHKECAEVPAEMNLSFHPNHNVTLKNIGYLSQTCHFCNESCSYFAYHCSCDLHLHRKCALFLYNLAEKRIGQLEHIRLIDPLISTENHGQELDKASCFACRKLLLDSEYLSPDSGFYLHTKCVDSHLEINHLWHRDHPLLLQFNTKRIPCDICQLIYDRGLVYCCSICKYVLCIVCATTIPTEIHHFCHPQHPLVLKHYHEPEPLPCQVCDEKIKEEVLYCCSFCEFALHIKCEPSPPTIQHRNHPHPFLLFKRRVSYTCDACGTPGNHVSYICPEAECSIIVHGKCISLASSAIKLHRHRHCLLHNYFLEKDEGETFECRVCLESVNTKHGSYFCSKCNYIVHVNCAPTIDHFEVNLAKIDEIDGTDETTYMAPYSRVSDTSINHFCHPGHDLEFSENIKEEKQCDGCSVFISTSYYYCSQCNFFLHESCAELSAKEHFWFINTLATFDLTSSSRTFECYTCEFETNGFAYYYSSDEQICLRCALVSELQNCVGHEHPVAFLGNEAVCNACGETAPGIHRCKKCDFNLCWSCLTLPSVVRHKSDVHLLKLTYGDSNDYSEYHYCDICEEKRNPNYWFYYCVICDTTAHPKCVIGDYSFIKPGRDTFAHHDGFISSIDGSERFIMLKPGKIYTGENHSHPLTFIQNVHFYPKCHMCDDFCLDLALECKEIGCSYVVHWKCIKPSCL